MWFFSYICTFHCTPIPNHLLLLGHCREVLDIKMLQCALLTWPSMWSLMSTNSDDLLASCMLIIFFKLVSYVQYALQCLWMVEQVYSFESHSCCVCNFGHLKFGSYFGLNSSLAFYPLCKICMSLASSISRGFCKTYVCWIISPSFCTWSAFQ